MDPSTLRWQEEDTCYYCNNGIVDTCEVVRLVHGTREYELHIDESTRSDREGRDIFVPVESDRLHFQHPEADRSMRVEHALCVGAALELAEGAEAPLERALWSRHSPGTQVCLSEVDTALSLHPGQFHSMVTS